MSKTSATFRFLRSFKYILCFGSTFRVHLANGPLPHLNTSYVLVQPLTAVTLPAVTVNLNTSYVLVQQLYCHYIRLSVCYLNTSYVLVQPEASTAKVSAGNPFKYILCFGSTGQQ